MTSIEVTLGHVTNDTSCNHLMCIPTHLMQIEMLQDIVDAKVTG